MQHTMTVRADRDEVDHRVHAPYPTGLSKRVAVMHFDERFAKSSIAVSKREIADLTAGAIVTQARCSGLRVALMFGEGAEANSGLVVRQVRLCRNTSFLSIPPVLDPRWSR